MAASAPSVAPIVCPGHTRPISELCFSAVTSDGVFFVSACVDQQPMLREGATGNWIGTFSGHSGAVWAAKMNRAATRCLTASADFDVRLWDAIAGSELGVFKGGHVLKAVTFTFDETRFVAGGYSKKILVFDPDSPGEPVMSIDHPTRIRKLAALSNGLVASGDEEGSIRLWSLEGDGSMVGEVPLEGAKGVVHDLTYVAPTSDGPMKDGGLLACVGRWVLLLSVSDAGEARVVRKIRTPFLARVDSASVHPGGLHMVLGGGDAASAATTRGGVASLYVFMVSLAESAAGSYAATASSPSSAAPKKRDFVGCSLVSISKGHVGPIRCLRFAPDGLRFASGGEDGNIRLWSFDAQKSAGTAGMDDLPAVDDDGTALDGGKGTKVGAVPRRGPKAGGGVYRPGAFGGAKKR